MFNIDTVIRYNLQQAKDIREWRLFQTNVHRNESAYSFCDGCTRFQSNTCLMSCLMAAMAVIAGWCCERCRSHPCCMSTRLVLLCRLMTEELVIHGISPNATTLFESMHDSNSFELFKDEKCCQLTGGAVLALPFNLTASAFWWQYSNIQSILCLGQYPSEVYIHRSERLAQKWQVMKMVCLCHCWYWYMLVSKISPFQSQSSLLAIHACEDTRSYSLPGRFYVVVP